MDILLLMLLVWAYNEQPKDAVSEEPEIVPIQEVEVPENAVNVTTVTQTAAVLTAIGEAMTGTSTATTHQLVQKLTQKQQVLLLQNKRLLMS